MGAQSLSDAHRLESGGQVEAALQLAHSRAGILNVAPAWDATIGQCGFMPKQHSKLRSSCEGRQPILLFTPDVSCHARLVLPVLLPSGEGSRRSTPRTTNRSKQEKKKKKKKKKKQQIKTKLKKKKKTPKKKKKKTNT
eukprot:NODE_7692_length_1557_cov_6.717483.p4 GENE.NODE_7692_length_1557_cov_6.717483~~NODE_7692_length_1557_cov_6.717483.p4  ORF type:complete len:138 (-),score=34.88 NODE_7692_length_1557_cov_6.717483:28-441(-)